MDGEWVPIVMFLTIGVVITLAFYYRFKTRREVQTTIRSAVERGQDLSPELIVGLMESLVPKHADLRKGIISLAIGVACFLFAGLLGEEDAEGPLMGIAMFPVLVGIGYLGMWFFVGRNK
jgi:hypothetical protein